MTLPDDFVIYNNPVDGDNTPEDPSDPARHGFMPPETHKHGFDVPRNAERPPSTIPPHALKPLEEPKRVNGKRLSPGTRNRDRDMLEAFKN